MEFLQEVICNTNNCFFCSSAWKPPWRSFNESTENFSLKFFQHFFPESSTRVRQYLPVPSWITFKHDKTLLFRLFLVVFSFVVDWSQQPVAASNLPSCLRATQIFHSQLGQRDGRINELSRLSTTKAGRPIKTVYIPNPVSRDWASARCPVGHPIWSPLNPSS